jgi:dolichyl-phosphate-mannose--protein O-mannosyl transferase
MRNSTHKLILTLILLFALGTRLYRLGIPPSYYFDEVYHAVTAKAYARNDPAGYEWWHEAPEPGTAYEWLHPPVSKLLMAGGIKLFGENAFAWRLPGALFGVLVIYLTYLLALQLTKQAGTALAAAALTALDGLLLSQSRIAMNDIYVTVFILATLLFYLRFIHLKKSQDLLFTGLCLGLAISTKWSGVFLLGIIGFSEGFLLAQKTLVFSLRRYFKLIIALVIIPTVIYVLSYTQFFLQGHTWAQFGQLHHQITWYQFHLEATHPYQSPAWQWPLLVKPVWTSVDYSASGKIGNIYAMSNPFISWFGLLAILWLTYKIIFAKKFQTTDYRLLTTGYFLVWLPWAFSPRIMFYYHYTPAIPLICIALAIFLRRLSHRSVFGRNWAAVMIALIVIGFFLYFPHWTQIIVPRWYDNFLYWLPSWK